MNPAMQIQLALLNNNFRIESADGRLKPKFAWTLRPLMRILPKHTSWRMAKEPAY